MARRKSICCCCTPYMAPSPVVPFFSAPSGCVSTVSKGALPARNPVSNDISPLSTVVNGVCPCVVTNRAARLSNLTGACPPPQPVQVVTLPSVVQAPVVPPVQAAPVAPPPVAAQPAPAPQPPDSQPPTAISPTQNAGCTGALGSLNVPSIVPKPSPCFSGNSVLAAPPAVSNNTDAALSVGAGTTTRQPDQIAPTMPAVIANPQVCVSAQPTCRPHPTGGNAAAAFSGNCACVQAYLALCSNQRQLQDELGNNMAHLDANGNIVANVCHSFMNEVIPALAMAGVGAAFAPVIGGLLPGAATATAAATPINVALSNAITSGVIGQAMGGCGLKSGLMAGVGAGLSAAAPYVSGITNTISGDISGGLQNLGLGACVSNTLGSAATGALGKAATSAGLAALTGGCIGKAAEAGAIAGGVSPLVNAGVGAALNGLCLTCCTAKTLAKIGASGLSQGAATSLLGGGFGSGLQSGLITGALSAVKCALKKCASNNCSNFGGNDTTYQPPKNASGNTDDTQELLDSYDDSQQSSSTDDSNKVANTETPSSPLDSVNANPTSNQDDTYRGGNVLNAFVSTNDDYQDPGIRSPSVFDPLIGTGGTNYNTTTDENSDTSTDAKTSPLDTVNTGNNDNQDTSTSDDGLQEVYLLGRE